MVVPAEALIRNSFLLRASTYCQIRLAFAPSSDRLPRLFAASRLSTTVCRHMPTTKGARRMALDIGLAPLRKLLTEHIRCGSAAHDSCSEPTAAEYRLASPGE